MALTELKFYKSLIGNMEELQQGVDERTDYYNSHRDNWKLSENGKN